MNIYTPAAYVIWNYGKLGWYPVFRGAWHEREPTR
jgi:hypothetical protein